MSDLSYTLGLDGGGFMSVASKVVGVMGGMELAVQGIVRAAAMMASSFAKAADMEKTTAAIETITKSAQVTAKVMADLKRLSADTPFEMSDLAPAARALLGAGTAAKDVAKQLRVLGDVAAGADTDIGGIVSVFNQVRGKGKLLTDDFIQLAERGVAGLREEIAKLKGIPINEVADALSRGSVSAKDLEAVLGRMTSAGGISFGAMQRQADTFAGKLSTLSDAWSSLQVAFAEPINTALKPVIDDITHLTEMLTPAFAAVGEQVGEVVTACHQFITGIEGGVAATTAMALAFGGLIEKAWELAGVPLSAIAAGLPKLGAAFLEFVTPVGNWLFARLEEAAHNFGAIIMSEMGALLAQSALTNTVGVAMMESARGQRDAAAVSRSEAEGIQNVDMVAGFMHASASLTESAKVMRDTFKGSLNDAVKGFGVGGTQAPGGEGAAAAVGEAIAQRIISRIDTPAGPMYTTLPGGGEGNGNNAVVVDALRGVLAELQRINTN